MTNMPIYTPPTEEEVAAKTQAFNDRLIKYARMMAILDSMYTHSQIAIDKYYILQDVFSEYYGFTKKSLYYWDGPHILKPIAREEHNRRPYVRRDAEYWEEYERKHKK